MCEQRGFVHGDAEYYEDFAPRIYREVPLHRLLRCNLRKSKSDKNIQHWVICKMNHTKLTVSFVVAVAVITLMSYPAEDVVVCVTPALNDAVRKSGYFNITTPEPPVPPLALLPPPPPPPPKLVPPALPATAFAPPLPPPPLPPVPGPPVSDRY